MENSMKREEVYFNKAVVVNFLGMHGRPGTKDYELATALTLHRWCENRVVRSVGLVSR